MLRSFSIISLLALAALLMTASSHAPSTVGQRSARYQSAHFMLEAPAGEEMGRLLEEMERAYVDVRTFGMSLPSRISARCYSSTAEFVRHSRGKIFNLALAHGERIHLQPMRILLRRGELPRMLRHELTHVALAGAARKRLPRWMNEGIAMVVAGEKLPERITFTRIEQLEDSLARSRSHENLMASYGTAERLASRLIARVGKERVLALLRGTASGGDFEGRFRRLVGSSVSEWGAAELKR